MYINEMTEDSEVILRVVSRTGKRLDLATKVVAPIAEVINGVHKVVVEPLFIEGTLLHFKNVIVTAVIVDNTTARTYEFKLIRIAVSKIGNNIFHVLHSTVDIKPLNRRENIRVTLGEPTVIRVGSNVKTYSAFVHDISVTGVSYSLELNDKLQEGVEVSSVFFYEPTDRTYRIESEIVRRLTSADEGNVIIGCQFQSFKSDIAALVSYILRQECKLRRLEQ